MKKLISLLLAVLLLATLCVPFTVSAEGNVISGQVLNSITEEEETGLGVAFLYTMNLKNTVHHSNRTFVSADIDGTDYKVVKLGAIVTNVEETGKDANAMVLENVNGIRLLNVNATRLWSWDENQLQYAVRVTKVPEDQKKTKLYARPYYIYVKDGEEVVVYGDVTSKSHYSVWCDNNPVDLPAVGTDIDVAKKKNRIHVSAAKIEDRTVTLTFKNGTTNWITEETDYVVYTCYDADNKAVKTETIYIGCIDTKKNKTKSFTFDVPDETTKVALTGSKIVYWTEWT